MILIHSCQLPTDQSGGSAQFSRELCEVTESPFHRRCYLIELSLAKIRRGIHETPFVPFAIHILGLLVSRINAPVRCSLM